MALSLAGCSSSSEAGGTSEATDTAVSAPAAASEVASASAVASAPAAASASAAAPGELDAAQYSLAGKTIGIAVVGTQHFWDREAFQGAVDEIERLGGTALTTDGGRDNTVHAQNHDVFLSSKVDGVITILGDAAVDPKIDALKAAGIPVFGVDHASKSDVNNSHSDNIAAGTYAGEMMVEALGGKGKVAVFNAFSEALSFCGERYESWKKVVTDAGIEIIEPELAEEFANAPEDARQQTLTLLQKYPVGTINAIHVACWDQPAIGVVQAIEDAGRTDVIVSAIDAGPDTLEIMMEPNSPFLINVAQQPRLIATTAADNVAKYLHGETVPPDSQLPVFPVMGPEQAQQIYTQLGYDKQ